MEGFAYGIGLAAAVLTAVAYIPQVIKAYPRGATEDLSLKTLSVLAIGLALWVVYGAFRGDAVIIVANAVAFALVSTLLTFKVRDQFGRSSY